jgi:hypothetical protein
MEMGSWFLLWKRTISSNILDAVTRGASCGLTQKNNCHYLTNMYSFITFQKVQVNHVLYMWHSIPPKPDVDHIDDKLGMIEDILKPINSSQISRHIEEKNDTST